MARGGKNRNSHTVPNTRKAGKTAAQRSGDRKRDSTDKDSGSGKIPNWAKFVIGAFVTAIVGLLVANLYPYLKDRLIHAPPVTFKVHQVVGPGWAVTVPDQARLQPRLNSIGNCNALHSAAIAAGGADDYGESLSVLLQGNSSSGVTVTGMHVRIVKRGAPLNGAYTFCQSAGSEEVMPINFNLNDQAPGAQGAPAGQKPKPSFFANGSVVHLNDGEVYPFRVGATVSGSAVQWVIEASVVVNGQSSTVTISDNGHPFLTTSALPMGQYGDLYEYDWASQQRLLHFRSVARNPDDCAGDVALKALRAQGLSGPAEVLTVDCAAKLAHVELWTPSDRCFVHYLGFHQQASWHFFASRAVCAGSTSLGALFSRATISHAGGDPSAFARAFGPYVVSSGSIPANPGPYDHVPRLSAGQLASRAGCSTMRTFASYAAEVGAGQVATCSVQGTSFLILTFADSASRNGYYSQAAAKPNSLAGRPTAGRQLVVLGPTWLIYSKEQFHGTQTYVAGRTEQQFAEGVGGESGQYAFAGLGDITGNEAPTIANGLL